jgi:nucleotide-binding universal stress UspA family protein
MKKIVIGYDESDAANRALERGAEFAKAFQAELIVASIAPVTTNIGRSAGPIDSADPPEAHVEELKNARAYLDEQGVAADYAAGIGHPAETIAQLANDREADMVIVGTRELGFFERLLGQSVSDSVAHKVHCDVLIVH